MEFKSAEVRIRFLDRIYGSLPRDLDVLGTLSEIPETGALATLLESSTEETLKDKAKALNLDPDAPPDEVETGVCSFRTHEVDGRIVLVLRDFMIKAAIGLAGQTSGMTKKTRGVRPVLREGLQIRPQHIPLLRNDEPIEQPDGQEVFAGHVVTMQGKRSILKKCDYVESPEAHFQCVWIGEKVKGADLKELIWFAGEFMGIGSQRRFEAGKYELLSFEEFDGDPKDALKLGR